MILWKYKNIMEIDEFVFAGFYFELYLSFLFKNIEIK